MSTRGDLTRLGLYLAGLGVVLGGSLAVGTLFADDDAPVAPHQPSSEVNDDHSHDQH